MTFKGPENRLSHVGFCTDGVGASLKVEVQDTLAWYLPVEDQIEQFRFLACALTATHQNISPQPDHALTEGAHLIEASGYSPSQIRRCLPT